VDVVIVGAGPSGCRTAEIVARKGYEVLILEEHPKIGKPVQCTGLVSKRIGKIPKEIVLNKIKRAKFCCGKRYFEIKSKQKMLLLDREKYDIWLAERAEKAGAKFKLSTRFLDFEDSKVFTDRGKIETKILVGADGPNSSVAKAAGIKLPKNLLFALQVDVNSRFDSDLVELWFGDDIAPGSFAWVVPENEEEARVGLLTEKNPNFYLENFLEKRFGRIKAKNKTGDFLRYGIIEKSVSNRVLLVGDAACQIKPFSGGGLVYNKICSEIAAKAIIKSLKENDFSEEFLLENYEKKWKKKLVWPILQGLAFKWIFSKISKQTIFFFIENFGITKFASLLDVDFLQK
jgi:geranylgeranyl reductase family protein